MKTFRGNIGKHENKKARGQSVVVLPGGSPVGLFCLAAHEARVVNSDISRYIYYFHTKTIFFFN